MRDNDIATCLHRLQLALKDDAGQRPNRLRPQLERCFPAVREIAGRGVFDLLATNFMLRCKAFRLEDRYLEHFPGLIHDLLEIHQLPALCSVATLELCCAQAVWQDEVHPLILEDLSHLPEEELLSGRLGLHPTVAIVCSTFPIVTLWISRRRGPGILDCCTERPEAALVLRPGAEVRIARLTLGLQSFIRALRIGLTVASAAQYAQVRDGLFQFPVDLWRLVEIGAFSSFDKHAQRDSEGLRACSIDRSLQ